jgi:hypothetical protein
MATFSVESAVSSLACGLSSNSGLIRRTANPHPNVWDYDFVHSLKSAYAVSNIFISLHTLLFQSYIQVSW